MNITEVNIFFILISKKKKKLMFLCMKWLVLSPFFVANKVEKQILLSKAKLKLLSNEQQPSKMSASHIRI